MIILVSLGLQYLNAVSVLMLWMFVVCFRLLKRIIVLE